jgi:WD40 repeat protein
MPDHLAGQTVACKECGADIDVPGRRRPRGSDGGSWLSANKGLVGVGGGVGLLILVVVWVLSRGENPAPMANNPGAPGNGPGPRLPLANPGLPRANSGAQPAPNVGRSSNVAQTLIPASVPAQPLASPNANVGRPAGNAIPADNVPRAGRGGFGLSLPTGSEIESLLQKRDGKPIDELPAKPEETLVTFARQAGQSERVASTISAQVPDSWNVAADPLPASVTFSSKPLTVPGPERSKLIVPRLLSPIAMFGDPSGEFVLINLSSMTQSKPLSLSLSGRSFAMSPDGDKIATLASSDQTSSEIGVFQTSNRRLLRTLTVEGRVSEKFFEFLDPERLAVSLNNSGGRERLAVIDVASGNQLCQPELGDDGHFEHVQISPGGRYLLHVDQKQGLIVCDSHTGTRVGQVALPRLHQHERNVPVVAAGASPDGAEFAAFLDDLSQQHLLVWNLATGRQSQHHVLENPELRTLRFGSSRPARVEFLSDGSGYLIDGSVWIDRVSGGIAWQDRDAQARLNRDSVRRLLPDDRLLLVETRERNFSVARDRPNARLTALDLGRISGRSLSRGEEPEAPVVVKTANSRTITLPADSVAWNVAADPAPSRPPLKRPQILGQGINGAASDFQYTLNASRLAIVDVPRRSSGSLGTAARLRAFDLTSGGLLFEAAVPPQTVALDISPDGRWLATTRGPGAIALWAFDAARPKLTFVPHKSSAKIQLCRFLDDGQLLVSAEESRERHRVSLWKVPECEQLYELELGTREVALRAPGSTMKGPFPIRATRFSHGGRYLVIDEGDRFRFLEAATGKFVGDLANAWPRMTNLGTENWDLTPFSADGRLFAVLLPYDSFDLLTVWDTTTGQLREQFSLSRNQSYSVMGSSGSMHFCGKNQMLLEDKLIDLSQHAVIWSYPFLRGVRLLDGGSRMQRLLDVPYNRGTVAVLAELEFPVDDALAEVREARSDPLPLVFGRGSQVTLDLS